ncbi:MAG: cytochrome C [Desulfuromonadaceae bacterium]|nr:cytochrome C [Desulfuromonadaceae bacterium]MDD2855472.1 cytochrome C [Desulfuromonadaceae bacterium]
MKIDKRDWFFIGVVATVLVVFIAISGKEKTTTVPNNEMHKAAYEVAFRNAPSPNDSIFKRAFFKPDKKGAEVFCEPCHKEMGVAFPPDHPAKNRCLFCHKLKR